jgi:hypothetical protein
MSAIRNLIAEANSAMAVLQDFQIKDDQLNQQIVELQQRLSGILQDRAELVPLLEEARGKEMKAQEDLRAFYQQVPPLPASPPASPKEQVPGAPKKKGGRPKDSPEKKAEKKLLSAQKKAKRLAGVAAGDPEAIAEQAKIDAQVALMQAGKAKKKEIYHQRLALEEDESDVPAMVLAGGGASV